MARNAVKVTEFYIEEVFDDGDRFLVFFDTAEEMFYEAAKFFAFNDLDTGMQITSIVANGVDHRYAGWMPDMRIQFRSCWSDELVYDRCFPEWDH